MPSAERRRSSRLPCAARGVPCLTRAPLTAVLALPALVAILLAAPPAAAQLVVNPRIVEFDPSADHDATLADGRPAVSHYDFEIYNVGATAPFHTMSLGKPSPGADGRIRVDFSNHVASWPLPGGTYEARVTAVGPAGSGRSTPSNPFEFVTCTYTLSPAATTVGAAAGSSSVTMNAPAGCSWTVSTATPWITLGTQSGTGTGQITFSFTANGTTSSRVGTITAGGQTLTVTQAGVTCTYAISPTSFTLGAGASTGHAATVTTSSGCAWTATTSAPWITLTTANGTGSGTLVFRVSENSSGATRTGTITVAGETVTVTQARRTPPSAPRGLRLVTAG